MSLPDYSTAIQTQISDFMSWGTVATLVAVVIGFAVGSVLLSMFLRTFWK